LNIDRICDNFISIVKELSLEEQFLLVW
jgi:hypothetical protein